MLPDLYNKKGSANYKGGLLKFSMRIYDRSQQGSNGKFNFI